MAVHRTQDPDYDEEVTIQELQTRIARDQIILQILLEQQQQQNNSTSNVKIPQNSSLEAQSRRRKMARSKEIILKHMLKITNECGVEAFVFGIVPSSGRPISAVSDNLRDWWQDCVKFDRNAPSAIVKYDRNIRVIGTDNPYVPPTVGPTSLMELQDQTLGSILSALTQHCNPPQREYPLDNCVAPPWWPKGNEEWWPTLGFPDGIEEMPYKKPHDLKKKVKCGVIIAVLRHMLPKVEEILRLVRSRGLGDKMSTKEIHFWFSVVKHEEENYWERNKGLLRRSDQQKDWTDLIENLMSSYADGIGDNEAQISNEKGNTEMEANVEPLSPDLTPKLINSDNPIEPVRFRRKELNNSRTDDDIKQMEMKHCLQLQHAEMKKKRKEHKKLQMDMNQKQMQQHLNINQIQQYQQNYQNQTYKQSQYNQIEMNQKLEPCVDVRGNIEIQQVQNQDMQPSVDVSNNIILQNYQLGLNRSTHPYANQGSNFEFRQKQNMNFQLRNQNLQQDQLAETDSGNYDISQTQQTVQPVNNFSGNYDNQVQQRNVAFMENQIGSTEMGYEQDKKFDEFELDYLIANANAFMHDI